LDTVPLDDVAAGLAWALLVLGIEDVIAQLRTNFIQIGFRLSFRVKHVPDLPVMQSPITDRDLLVLKRDGGKVKDDPVVAIPQKESAEIVIMRTLHDDDDRAFLLVIQPRVERIFELCIHVLALGVRGSVRRFERVINDYNMAATAG
jgi:hypothetical protein